MFEQSWSQTMKTLLLLQLRFKSFYDSHFVRIYIFYQKGSSMLVKNAIVASFDGAISLCSDITENCPNQFVDTEECVESLGTLPLVHPLCPTFQGENIPSGLFFRTSWAFSCFCNLCFLSKFIKFF